MTNSDSPALAEARNQVDAAVKAFVTVRAAEMGHINSYTVGWAAYAEFTSTDLIEDETAGNVVIVPEDQHATITRGCFEFGRDAFTR